MLKPGHSSNTKYKWPPHCDVGLDKSVLRKQTAGNSHTAVSTSGACRRQQPVVPRGYGAFFDACVDACCGGGFFGQLQVHPVAALIGSTHHFKPHTRKNAECSNAARGRLRDVRNAFRWLQNVFVSIAGADLEN